jgi:hypothetical protein
MTIQIYSNRLAYVHTIQLLRDCNCVSVSYSPLSKSLQVSIKSLKVCQQLLTTHRLTIAERFTLELVLTHRVLIFSSSSDGTGVM